MSVVSETKLDTAMFVSLTVILKAEIPWKVNCLIKRITASVRQSVSQSVTEPD